MRTKRFHIGQALLLTLGFIIVGSLIVHWSAFVAGFQEGVAEGNARPAAVERTP